MMTTICGCCEHEWPTDSGRQVCPKCGNDGEIEGHVVRQEMKKMKLDFADPGEYPAADRQQNIRQLHNIMVVQSIKGWKLSDYQQAMLDAKNGIVYRLPNNKEKN